MTVLVLAIALAAPAAANAFGGLETSTPPRRYVVRAGDTVWAIATRLAPQDDPREVVARLIEANDLEGGAIVPGQVLILDAG